MILTLTRNPPSYFLKRDVFFYSCLPSGVPADLKSAVKKGSTYETGGFVIPHNFPINNQRLSHNNHFQQSPTPCIIYRRTIEIILRIPHELRPHRILMNIIQLLLEKLERRNHLSITPILPKMILVYPFI